MKRGITAGELEVGHMVRLDGEWRRVTDVRHGLGDGTWTGFWVAFLAPGVRTGYTRKSTTRVWVQG